jgi:hypothetical protein
MLFFNSGPIVIIRWTDEALVILQYGLATNDRLMAADWEAPVGLEIRQCE